MHSNTSDISGHAAGAFPRRTLGFWRSIQAMVRRVNGTLALWHLRARSRREIERLEDRILRDIGIDRSEANKPFWRE